MKEEWKPDALRETAEEIRSAVMPKSITPEMVGGTLLALTNAVGEVVETLGEIPREHVKVTVRGYDGEGAVSGAGATVLLDVFHSKGYPVVSLPRQELTADENGVVEFDVPHGYKYAVFSQIAGLGASFQLVKTAAAEARKINLWNLPIGVKHLYLSALFSDKTGAYRSVPYTSDTYVSDWDVMNESNAGWDVQDEDEYFDDYYYYGILVSTAETSFVIAQNSLSEDRMVWCSNQDYGALIPGIPAINNLDENGMYVDDLWADAQNRARADMDGNMNTTKIFDYAHNAVAANFCADYIGYPDEQRWLPSAGQAYLMWLNRTVINALMTEANDGGCEFALFPYQNEKGSWVYPNKLPNGSTRYEYWWTSTIYNEYCSWVVGYNGDIYYYGSDFTYDVRAVSAFHFEY